MNGEGRGSKYFDCRGKDRPYGHPFVFGVFEITPFKCRSRAIQRTIDPEMLFVPLIELFLIVELEEDSADAGHPFQLRSLLPQDLLHPHFTHVWNSLSLQGTFRSGLMRLPPFPSCVRSVTYNQRPDYPAGNQIALPGDEGPGKKQARRAKRGIVWTKLIPGS